MVKKVYKAQGVELPFVDIPHLAVSKASAPGASDKDFAIGDIWMHRVSASTRAFYAFGGLDSSGDAIWSVLSPGSSDVDTLTGDSGGAISPSGAGNITIAGGTNITSVGSDSGTASAAITLNLDAAIVLATSVSAPLYTVAAGNDLAITAASSQNIVIKMGNDDDSSKVSFTDSGDVEVFSIDDGGSIGTLAALTVSGLITGNGSATIITAGTALNLATDNSADAVNIAVGTSARDVHLADSAAAHTLTIGSSTGAASTDIQYGTGNFTLDGGATGNITVADSMTSGVLTIGGSSQTGNFVLGPSDGIMTMNIANSDGAKTINIGAGVDGNTVAVANGINTSAQTVNVSAGAAAADSTVNILTGTATAGTQTLNMATADYAKTVNLATGIKGNTVNIATGDNDTAQTVSISNGASAANSTVNVLSGVGTGGAGTLNLANNTRVTTVDICDIAPAAARTVTICGGDSAQNDTLDIMPDNPSANNQTVNILSGTPTGGTQVLNLLTQVGQAGTINLGTGAAMANAINIGGTGACTIALGNTQTAGSVSIGDAMTSGTIDIGGSGLQTGTITLGGGTGAQTINLATGGTGVKTVNLGTGAVANVVTVGSTTGAASLTLQSGTGEITVTGTVKEIDAEFLSSSGDYIASVSQNPILQAIATTGAAPVGTIDTANIMYMQEGVALEVYNVSAQTIIAPRMDTFGLNIALDQAVGEGAEYNWGAARTNSRHAFTIGTDAAFFFEVGLYIDDMDGAAPYVIGFRKSEANNATFANYTDYASIGMIAGSSTTKVVTATELNSTGQTVTISNDNWGGDQTTNTLKVLVDASGNVTYTLNGVALDGAVAFQFDNTDVVCPFIRIEHSASATDVGITSLKVGYQA